MALERELKYSVLDAYVPSLSELRAGLSGTPYDAEAAPVQEIEDRYYDDASDSLQRAGLALRLRSVNGRRFASLKAAGSTEGALHQRDELEIPLEGANDAPQDPPAWPEPILERLPGGVPPVALAPRVELATTRVRFHLERDGRRLAELAFDAVSARVPGGERSAHFDEVEIEGADDADSADLEAIAEAVDGIVQLTPNPVNKLERAAALLLLATW